METILVPTDFSEAAKNATDYAVELAKLFDADLILVNAVPVPMTGYDSVLPIEMMGAMQKSAQEELEALKAQILAKSEKNISIQCHAEIGNVYDIVENAAAEFYADLIVMGIVGEAGKIKEHIIGSTAVKVARQIQIPAFIIPEKVSYHPIHKISFACDLEGTEDSDIVYLAKYFTKLFGAELEVINVEHPEEEFTVEKVTSNLFLERKLQNTKHKTTFITNTNVARGLQDYFILHPTDVVLLNPKKHNVFHNLFTESLTNELAFHLHLPILAIK